MGAAANHNSPMNIFYDETDELWLDSAERTASCSSNSEEASNSVPQREKPVGAGYCVDIARTVVIICLLFYLHVDFCDHKKDSHARASQYTRVERSHWPSPFKVPAIFR
jgi:hypothetical protein